MVADVPWSSSVVAMLMMMIRSWIEQSLRVLKNATAQLAAPLRALEVMKELCDPIEIEFC